MVTSLDSFVSDVKANVGNPRNMIEIVANSHEMLMRSAPNIDNVFEILDIQECSIAHAAVLRAKYSLSTLPDFETLFMQTQQFFYNCSEDHIKHIPYLYTFISHNFTKQLVSRNQAIRGISVLLHALKKLQDEPGQLTSIHSDLCQLALSAKCYKPILPMLDEDITDLNDEGGKFDAKDYLSYYYYGGMIYLALKKIERSIYFFELCMLIPAYVTSKIMVEAYKKYILVSLILYGKLMPINKQASSVVAQRNFKVHLIPYSEFAAAYTNSNTSNELREIIDKHRDVFNRDKNMGLVKQCVARQVKLKIQRLTKTFMTLSLADVASRVGLTSLKAAEDHILEMIECGEIYASISQKDGMVCFLDNPEKYDTSSMLSKLQTYMNRCMQLEQQVFRLSDQVVTSPNYVKKLLESEAKSGKTSGQF